MRKFLYLILFVMTLCVFCCSCSQKTNDVKKTSSQHEKKLKSVPNNNTKEDVISEEDLEKGYDLPVSAQENEEATRDSMQIMSGLEHIYRNADKGDSLNVVLDNKSICKMIKKIKQQGYSVTVSEDYSNMENYKRFSSFLAKAQKKQKGSGVIYEVHSEGSIGREKFIYDGKDMFLLASNASWDDNGKPIITFVSYTRIKKWRYSRKGWFCYELCVPEYPEVTEMVDGSCLIRIKPMSDNKRKLSRKCVRGLAYQGNNILCSNWDQEHMQKIDYNGLYEYLYAMKYKKKFNGKKYPSGIPKDQFEQLIMEYLPVSREEIEKYASYNEKKKTYDWMRLGCFNYAPNFFGTSIPEVTKIKHNSNGTVTLTVDAVCEMVLCNEAVITHELTVKFNKDGSFRYLGNKILNGGIKKIPEYQYRILKEKSKR
jgi:TusA-related sulfurtransferase